MALKEKNGLQFLMDLHEILSIIQQEEELDRR